jgi:hypothetical protein
MRRSPMQSMEPELNGGEGVSSLGWGATPSSSEAPGPAHREKGGVRWLGTDGVAENRGERGGDGLPEVDKAAGADKMQWEGLLL